jgi:hypothetical protein
MNDDITKQIADFFALTIEQLINQDDTLLQDLFKQWAADEFGKVHNLGYNIVR